MKQFLLGLLLNLILVLPTLGQELKVEGIVTDLETGEPLIGVTIVVEGTTTGTTTDYNGTYSLNVPGSEATLVYSFIGMNQIKEQVNGRTKINVALSADTEMLEEVMVVAYGTATKEAYTGAAQVVDKETLKERPVTSFEKSLQGTTAGLLVTNSSGQPGSSATVRIRGIGSLSASSSPLYVIDGVPMSGALSDINPNDIESLTVLKDAAASSLYGSRAANGVIIITTKQGAKGQTKISFSGQTGISSRISGGYALMNSTQFYEHSWQGLYNQALIDGELLEDARRYANENVEEIVGFNPFGIENPLDENGKLIPGTAIMTDTDWRDLIYKTGLVQNYNLNVSGGTENTKIFFSLGYFDDNGTTLNSNFKRYTAKINASHKVNSFITAGMNNHFSYSVTNAPPGGSRHANPVRSAEIINAATPVYNPDGTYNWDNTAVFDFNPLGLSELDIYAYNTKRALINAFINVQFLPSLSFKTTGAVDYSGNEGLNYFNPFHGDGAGVNGRSSQSSSDNMAWNISNILLWNKRINNSSFEVLAGHEAHGEEYSVLSAGVTDFSVAGRPELVWGASPETPSSYSSKWTMMSFLGQAKYSYKGRYYITGSIRSDGSSRFGENNKFGTFYSMGGSWRITEEEWMPKFNWLNTLKIRSSYGTSGNNNIGNYASLGLYGSGANYGGFPGLAPVQLGNDDLTWEKIASFNLGFEFRFIKKLHGSFEYYNRKSDGLLYAKPLSASKGFRSIMTNLGAMSNSGLELTLNYDLVSREDFQYSIGANISTNDNKILNLSTDKIISGTKLLEVGESMYQFYLREWAGVNPDNGQPMWFVNENSDDFESNELPEESFEDPLGSGRMVTSDYNSAERVRLGSALPKYFGGFSNNVSYKNFDFSFYFYLSLGGQVYNYDYATNMHDGTQPGYNMAVDALNAWTPENRYTNVPRFVTNNQDQGNQLSSRFLEDVNYLRLKNISLGYNLPQKVCERIKLSGLRVFVSGENIWTLSNFKGFDPEGAINGTTSNSIPGIKVFTFGVKVDL